MSDWNSTIDSESELRILNKILTGDANTSSVATGGGGDGKISQIYPMRGI